MCSLPFHISIKVRKQDHILREKTDRLFQIHNLRHKVFFLLITCPRKRKAQRNKYWQISLRPLSTNSWTVDVSTSVRIMQSKFSGRQVLATKRGPSKVVFHLPWWKSISSLTRESLRRRWSTSCCCLLGMWRPTQDQWWDSDSSTIMNLKVILSRIQPMWVRVLTTALLQQTRRQRRRQRNAAEPWGARSWILEEVWKRATWTSLWTSSPAALKAAIQLRGQPSKSAERSFWRRTIRISQQEDTSTLLCFSQNRTSMVFCQSWHKQGWSPKSWHASWKPHKKGIEEMEKWQEEGGL